VLAVDGGNSKTDVVLLGADGRLLGGARGGGTLQAGRGLETGMAALRRTVERACRAAGVRRAESTPVARVGVFALAGADFPSDERRLARALARRGWAEVDLVRNDTFAVLRAGTDRSWWVAVVTGAGINCVGVAPNGRTVRFPALGAISGDWGDGRDIGTAALAAAVRGRDGRGERTVLEREVPSQFGLASPAAVVRAIHEGRVEPSRLMELPPVVFSAARAGDQASKRILERLAGEVVSMAVAAVERLRVGDRDVDVVLGGGLMQHADDWLLDRIAAGVHLAAPSATVTRIASPPIAGAALLGLEHLGARDGVLARGRRAVGEWAGRRKEA
jgi:N-acetylglucosamine kinase-like BadF-type ATPase